MVGYYRIRYQKMTALHAPTSTAVVLSTETHPCGPAGFANRPDLCYDGLVRPQWHIAPSSFGPPSFRAQRDLTYEHLLTDLCIVRQYTCSLKFVHADIGKLSRDQ